jgi:OmpA-OmpF porin, OOP family
LSIAGSLIFGGKGGFTMLKKIVSSVCCFIALFVLCSSASAQTKPITFYVSPYFGGYVFDSDQRLGNMPVYGIRLGYEVTKYFAAEVSGEYVFTKYDVDVSDSRNTNVYSSRLDAVYNVLPDSFVVPFVFAGFGGQYIEYPRNVTNKSAFTADYGVGLKYNIKDWLALRADVRQIYIFDNSKKDFEYVLGAVFYFGGRQGTMTSAGTGKSGPKIAER